MTVTRKHRSTRERARLFALHRGVCHLCNGKINGAREAWDISHDIPLELGGADDDENSKPAHRKCHRKHTSEVDIPLIAKMKRREARNNGSESKRSSFQTNKNGPFKKKLNGQVERRT